MRHNCPFCPLTNRQHELIADFDLCYAILDRFPVSKGHVLIIPKKHIQNWFEASKELQYCLLDALDAMKKWLDNAYSPSGYNIGMDCGSDAGQSIFHLHIHLIPRYYGDMENPRGGVRGVIPSRQNYPIEIY